CPRSKDGIRHPQSLAAVHLLPQEDRVLDRWPPERVLKPLMCSPSASAPAEAGHIAALCDLHGTCSGREERGLIPALRSDSARTRSFEGARYSCSDKAMCS